MHATGEHKTNFKFPLPNLSPTFCPNANVLSILIDISLKTRKPNSFIAKSYKLVNFCQEACSKKFFVYSNYTLPLDLYQEKIYP